MERRIFCTAVFVFGLLIPHQSVVVFISCFTVLSTIILWRPRLRSTVAFLLFLTSLGVGYVRSAYDSREVPKPNYRSTIEVEGTIVESPRRWGKSSVFFFQVERLDGQRVSPFKVLVRWSACEQTLEVGDRWGLRGLLKEGDPPLIPGGFDQRGWLWTQRAIGVLHLHAHSQYHYLGPPRGSTPHQLSYRARAWMMKRLERVENERARSLIAGVVFGETQSLPPDLQEQFRRTGTSHLLAASGMNVALLAGLIILAGRLLGLGAWRVAPLAIPAVIGYAFLAGCAPSITRAATGATLALTALSLGRTSNAWNTLCLSVWGLLLWDPRQLFDLGFQLSVVAVMGLVGGPKPPEKCSFVGKSVVLTISASLVTLPIFWWSFGELSSSLLIANLLLGPVVELLFPLGLLATLLPAKPLLLLSEWVARLSLWMVDWLSQLADPIRLTRPGLLCSFLIGLALLAWWGGRDWRLRSLALPAVVVAVWLCLYSGHQSSCAPGELMVRKIGREKSIYWISTSSREVLLLQETWQLTRARDLLRQSGSLITPEIRFLQGSDPSFRWGDFSWSELKPYLPACSYLEVKVRNGRYTVMTIF